LHPFATIQPEIWILLTQAGGDNDQCLAFGEALGRPTTIKRLDWPVADAVQDRAVLRALLADTPDAEQRRSALGLHAPWPRVVICCGRRSDRVAFWIKRQSGGRTRIVSVGRARLALSSYDLLVAPPHFPLPARANVVNLPLPMTRRRHGDDERNARARDAVVPVPKPWFTILLGGEVKQFAACERRLVEAARHALEAADRHRGSVVASTSRRTPPDLLGAIERVLDRPYIYRWSGSAGAENPYEILLRDSAALFVTADSASMILDCCASGTPTYVIEYPERLDLRARWRRALFQGFRRTVESCRGWGLGPFADRLDRAQDWMHARRVLRYPRDLRRFHASVYRLGFARPAADFDPAVLPRASTIANDLSEISGIRTAAARCLALSRAPLLAAE
jgi:mitochondrial fission protein ELM1